MKAKRNQKRKIPYTFFETRTLCFSSSKPVMSWSLRKIKLHIKISIFFTIWKFYGLVCFLSFNKKFIELSEDIYFYIQKISTFRVKQIIMKMTKIFHCILKWRALSALIHSSPGCHKTFAENIKRKTALKDLKRCALFKKIILLQFF